LAVLSWARPAAAKKPNADLFSIERIEYSGEGCPTGSVSAAVTDDSSSFILIFSRMYAEAGPAAGAAAARQTCKVHLQVRVPKGWSYALAAVDFHGFAGLDAAVNAWQQTTYHLSGESPEKTAAFTWQGEFNDEYAVQDLGAGAPPYWSRCGGGKNLMITTTIAVDNSGDRTASGLLELDDIDGELFHLAWQHCN
jgi:hypothetical protein